MRIGLVTQAYYPVLGGVTEHVWHLGQELQRRGHTVTVVTGAAPQADDRGLHVIRGGFQIPLAANGANVHVTLGWKLGRWLQRVEQEHEFDLVHIQSPLDPGLPMIASKNMRRPKVGTYHTYREVYLPWQLFPGLFRGARNALAAHIAVSPSAEWLVHKYFPDTHMDIIPNGIDTDRFHPAVEPFPQYRDGKFTILYVGRMDPRKGAKFLFMTLPFLEQALEGNYRVLVVGTGWMKKYYDAYIPLSLRDRVEFAGYASPEDIPRYYRSADVYCSPATGGESFGIVLVEAMASGVPVVASDIEGYRWVVEPGQEGLLVPPRSSRHLANALIALARDPSRRAAMGRAGRQTAQTYAWPTLVDHIERVYQRVLDPNGARA